MIISVSSLLFAQMLAPRKSRETLFSVTSVCHSSIGSHSPRNQYSTVAFSEQYFTQFNISSFQLTSRILNMST